MRFIYPGTLESKDFTFNDLEVDSNRFANLLAGSGFQKGDIFFTFLPKLPEQFISFLGGLKLQLIVGTLFSNFGDEALVERLQGAKGIITRKSLLKRVLKARERLPALQTILVSDLAEDQDKHILSYARLMEKSNTNFSTPTTSAETPAVLHYTSGSTAKPKGVLHVHGGIVAHSQSAREILQLNDDEIFWCTADQGWVTGTTYGISGPWSLGVTQMHYGGGYDPRAWFQLLEREKVSIWYTAPTALRMLMREDEDMLRQYKLDALKYIFSVGEPLNPEVLHWGRRVLARDIHDTWFQTETGSIMIANHPGMPIKPGSMGKPLNGIQAVIVSDEGKVQKVNTPGNLCLKPGWPSMFVTYLNNEEVYRERFRHGYYFTGDMAQQDEEGYFWFLGRSDDVINTAGHLVSPFEVESSLLELKEVAESGVIGAPDDILFEKVVAFVVLRPPHEWSDELDLKMRLHISNRISSMAAPQEIRPVESLPKNKSGKIMRRVLKAWYLGQDSGDLSTLEI